MPLPIIALPIIKTLISSNAMNAVFGVLKKYWPHLLVIGLVLYGLYRYGEYREDVGVQKTTAHYEAILKEKAEAETRATEHMVAEYESLVNAAREKEQAAEAARIKAERESARWRRESGTYYDQLGEMQNELEELRDALDVGAVGRVSHGFVGLHNLAVQIQNEAGTGSPIPDPGLSDVSEAAGLDRGTPTDALVAESEVTLDQVAQTIRYNYKIANQCLNDRKQMKDYIDELCKLGFCK